MTRRRRTSRTRRRLLRFGLVALALWIGQVALLAHRLRRFDWDEYWLLRGFYRPGVILFRSVAGPFVPRDVFDPLHPGGARVALLAAALIYAVAVAGLVAIIGAVVGSKR